MDPNTGNNSWYSTFDLGRRGVHATAYFAPRDSWVGVNLWLTDVVLHEELVVRGDEVGALLADLGRKTS